MGAGLDEMVQGEGAELGDMVQGAGAGLDETVQGVGAGLYETSEDTARQGGSSYPLANPRLVEAHDDGTLVQPTGAACSAPGTLPGTKHPHSQNLTDEGQGARKRATSDTGSSTSSSKSDNSIKANHKSTSAKIVMAKRRRQSGRQDNVLERHRHHSVSEVYYGTREQVQEADDERDNEKDATRARQDGERDDDGDAANTGRDDERDDDRDAINPRHDIQARLRRSPDVIMAGTWANRPQQTR